MLIGNVHGGGERSGEVKVRLLLAVNRRQHVSIGGVHGGGERSGEVR